MFARQVCFRTGKNSTIDDIDESGDDENVVSVDDLLAQAATDPDNDENASDEERGSPLSAGMAFSPANTNYRNTLLWIFHDTVHRAPPPLSLPYLPSLAPMPGTSSQTTMTSTFSIQSQSHGQQSSNEDPDRDDMMTSARINSNGKRPHGQLLVHDKENFEHPLPPVHASNKKPRGGSTMAGRGGHGNK
jgi:hypothetical protein